MQFSIGRNPEERIQVVKRVQAALHGEETQEEMRPARAPSDRHPDQKAGQRNADEEAELVGGEKARQSQDDRGSDRQHGLRPSAIMKQRQQSRAVSRAGQITRARDQYRQTSVSVRLAAGVGVNHQAIDRSE